MDDNWLPDSIKCSKCVRLPKPSGMDPEKLLWLRSNCSRFSRNVTCVVMGPDKMFSLRLTTRRFCNGMVRELHHAAGFQRDLAKQDQLNLKS